MKISSGIAKQRKRLTSNGQPFFALSSEPTNQRQVVEGQSTPKMLDQLLKTSKKS